MQQQFSQQYSQQNVQQNKRTSETEVMLLARKIKNEQGDKTAGHFLYAMKPYAAPGEINHIESLLDIRAERDPAQNASQQGKGNMNMMQLLLRLMQQGGKPDPMSLMRMMSGGAM